jgi:hypothetical protein
MLKSEYIEDIFVTFYETYMTTNAQLQQQDLSAASSFYYVIDGGKELTQNQANFLLKILQKYKMMMLSAGLDYRDALDDPKWKKPFRVIDFSKKVFVEKDNDGTVWVCAKFPYQLKKEFDHEFEDSPASGPNSVWDADRKLRKIPLYWCNLVHMYEFAQRHNFEIDDTFMIALADVEEIWQNQDEILPFSTTAGSQILLGNSSEETDEWFHSHAVGIIENDLLLAKSMGYLYRGKPRTPILKIAASPENSFWVKTNTELFNIFKYIDGKMCVVLDRTGNMMTWLTSFINDADKSGFPRSEIKVCFRENKEENTGINQWIKDNQVGGKVDDGKILIFDYKPAKWLFKEQENVKLLVTNNLYPATNTITKDWLSSHPCVIYLGDIKPATQRGHTIVDL